jgi:hypothetical protein
MSWMGIFFLKIIKRKNKSPIFKKKIYLLQKPLKEIRTKLQNQKAVNQHKWAWMKLFKSVVFNVPFMDNAASHDCNFCYKSHMWCKSKLPKER